MNGRKIRLVDAAENPVEPNPKDMHVLSQREIEGIVSRASGRIDYSYGRAPRWQRSDYKQLSLGQTDYISGGTESYLLAAHTHRNVPIYTDGAPSMDRPELSSGHPRMYAHRHNLYCDLAELVADPVKDYILTGPTGNPGGFHSVLCVAGTGMTPRPSPFIENAAYVRWLQTSKPTLDVGGGEEIKRGRASSSYVTEADRFLADVLAELLIRPPKASSMHFRRGSTLCAPIHSTSMEDRMALWKHIARAGTTPYVLAAGGDKDLRTYFEMFAGGHIAVAYERQQGEPPWKGRYSPRAGDVRLANYEQRISTKRLHSWSSSAPPDALLGEKGVFRSQGAMRARLVAGTNGTATMMYAAIMACHVPEMLLYYEATMKTRHAKDKANFAARQRDVWFSDLSNMDWSVRGCHIDSIAHRLTEFYDDYVVRGLLRHLRSSYICKIPHLVEGDGTVVLQRSDSQTLTEPFDCLFGAHPFDSKGLDEHLFMGLQSGCAPNKLVGTYNCAYAYLWCALEAGLLGTVWTDLHGRSTARGPAKEVGSPFDPSIESLRTRLAGALDRALLHQCDPRLGESYTLLMSTDDAEHGCTSEGGSRAWMTAAATCPYALIEFEVMGRYLGSLLRRDEAGAFSAAGDPRTYVSNVVAAERGVHGKDPFAVALGHVARQLVYASPACAEVERVWRRRQREDLGVDFHELYESWAAVAGIGVKGGFTLSDKDALAVAKPEAIHYLLEADELSSHVRDFIVASVPANEVHDLVSGLFRS